ncbi:hypothetical protein PENTCL1PPCAC_28936, partial [Pristionchus entomophagus]
DDLHIVELVDDTKEDSQTPTDKGSIMDEDECLPSNSKLANEVTSLQKQCTVLSHQMNMIMGALRLPRCACPTCIDAARHNQLPHMRLPCQNGNAAAPAAAAAPPTPHAAASAPAAPQLSHALGTPVAIPIHNGVRIINPQAMMMQRVVPPVMPVTPVSPVTPIKEMPSCLQPESRPTVIESTPSENGSTSTEGESKEPSVIHTSPQTDAAAKQFLTTLGVIQSITSASTPSTPANPFAEQNHGGRRSKYCTPEEKREVAEYASKHGAANAARKFGIPASVAAYYQRKLAKIKQNGMQATALVMAQSLGVPPVHIKPESMPSTADSIESPMMNLDCTPGTPTTPSFLRGRGRGRPKLIGDELDAELIEYMVKLKTEHPTFHLNADGALELARDYILKHSPGILKENGGNVELKKTWAMKLVSRIAERQEEIKLGLPAGALNNYGRTGLQQLQSLSGVNNIFSDLFNQLAKTPMDQIMMPEITNVKELNLSDFTAFADDSMNEEKEHDGSTTPEVNDVSDEAEAEKAIEGIQSCQASLTAC